MKRSIVVICLSMVSVCILGAVGCSPEPSQPRGRAAQSGWTLPPSIEAAERQGTSLRIRGRAAPAGRIVLRGAGSTAYAVSADDQGRFEVRIAVPSTDTLFVIETQSGQVGFPAPYRLLVSTHPTGPIALVGSGVSSIRLDITQGLDVVDSDGGATIASGRTAANRQLDLILNEETRPVRADATGRWSSILKSQASQSLAIGVAGQTFLIPNLDMEPTANPLERDGAGWRLVWKVSPGITQTSWFPDRV